MLQLGVSDSIIRQLINLLGTLYLKVFSANQIGKSFHIEIFLSFFGKSKHRISERHEGLC